jgi:3-isopropylmalate/(R)-2-methylmalate dehydratase small subunit
MAAKKAAAVKGKGAKQAKTPAATGGRAWKFGDNIDTDAIIPGRFLVLNTPEELSRHAFEGTRDEFAKKVKAGDVVVGGKNFGCGSSREHAPLALIGSGIHVVLAQSFARIFFRNSINTGVLPVVCPKANTIADGANVTLHLKEGYVEAGGKKLAIEPVPPFMQKIADAGGLVEYAKGLKEVPGCTTSQQ